jgi:hypothetical protein
MARLSPAAHVKARQAAVAPRVGAAECQQLDDLI